MFQPVATEALVRYNNQCSVPEHVLHAGSCQWELYNTMTPNIGCSLYCVYVYTCGIVTGTRGTLPVPLLFTPRCCLCHCLLYQQFPAEEKKKNFIHLVK